MENQYDDEEIMRARRRRRIAEAKRRKRKQRMIRRLIRLLVVPAAGVIMLIILITAGLRSLNKPDKDTNTGNEKYEENEITDTLDEGYGSSRTDLPKEGIGSAPEGDIGNSPAGEENDSPSETKVYSARTTSDTRTVGENVMSNYAIFIDLDSGSILAQRDAKAIISPASMTKILTVLVAAEHMDEKDLDDTFTITRDITDYSYVNDCSSAGFDENEVVTVRDLFYGTILPSGADAAAGLAIYVAGSLDAFVDMMNDKLEELGLSETAHFTNCVGLYDKNHYCTLYDMAMIMQAAMDNELCREVMTAHTYTTSETIQHPEGITISNWFLRRIEDKDTGGEVLCAKTGYVVQSKNCAASYGVDKGGKEYICVTADAHSGWRCIYDHVELYKQFATE